MKDSVFDHQIVNDPVEDHQLCNPCAHNTRGCECTEQKA